MYKLTITYDEEKNVLGLDGPIRHPVLCYGMLELAKDVIKDLSDIERKKKKKEGVKEGEKEGTNIEIAPAGILKDLDNKRILS